MMKKWVLALCALVLAAGTARAAVVGEEVSYSADGITMKGYLAWDDELKNKRPGVLVVHEWWGHNEYARKRARMLAEMGYTALAVDMYGEGRNTEHPKEAGAFAGAVRKNMDGAEARFRAAFDLLKNHETVAPQDIAAIGYCFGGGIVLEMARRGVDLKAVASFHGSLATANPAGPGDIKARILVAHGGADPLVKPEDVAAFKAEMEKAGAAYTFIEYPGAKHAFTNPDADKFAEKYGLPLAYDADADAKSWNALKKLLKLVFTH